MEAKLQNGHALRIAKAIEMRNEARRSLQASAGRIVHDLTGLPKAVKHGVKEDLDDAVTSALPSEIIRRNPKTAVAIALVCGFGVGALLIPAAAEVTMAGRARRYGSRLGNQLRGKFSEYTSSMFGEEERSPLSEAAMIQAKGIARSLALSLASAAATSLLNRMIPSDREPAPDYEDEAEGRHSYE